MYKIFILLVSVTGKFSILYNNNCKSTFPECDLLLVTSHMHKILQFTNSMGFILFAFHAVVILNEISEYA